MNKKNTISVVIIAKNEEEKIGDALKSVDWADELIVVDTGSIDKTVSIAKTNNAKVIEYDKGSFNDWRNIGLESASGQWLLYLDADERITPVLKQEINTTIVNDDPIISVYAIARRNFILGKEFKYGGEAPDYQIRFFKKNNLKKWKGNLHEKPEFNGELGYLTNPMIHLKHDNIEDMVTKTNEWSEIEAELIYQNGHPQMRWWRFIRIMFSEAFDRLIKKQGFRDGKEGVIYSLYQVWSRFLTYAKLWEMQIKTQK